MNSRILTLIITFIFTFPIIAQDNNKSFDIRLGVGVSLLASGDMRTFNYENELNYRLNSYFSSALSIGLGSSNYGAYEHVSFTQGNGLFFFSPFRNNGKYDLRLGAGLSFCNLSYTVPQGYILDNKYYSYGNDKSFGANIVMEYTYLFNSKYLLGLKIFSQPYSNGGVNSGLMLKVGMKI